MQGRDLTWRSPPRVSRVKLGFRLGFRVAGSGPDLALAATPDIEHLEEVVESKRLVTVSHNVEQRRCLGFRV